MDDPEIVIVILLIAGELHNVLGIIALCLAASFVVGGGPSVVRILVNGKWRYIRKLLAHSASLLFLHTILKYKLKLLQILIIFFATNSLYVFVSTMRCPIKSINRIKPCSNYVTVFVRVFFTRLCY